MYLITYDVYGTMLVLAGIAQLVEQWIENPRVSSSNLDPGNNLDNSNPYIYTSKVFSEILPAKVQANLTLTYYSLYLF